LVNQAHPVKPNQKSGHAPGHNNVSAPRRRIVEATRQLLQSEGYAGMTIEAVAHRAEVSAQSVYAIFKSKTGILTELLDQSTFGPDYDDAVRQAMSASDPETRLRIAARIARQIHDAQSAACEVRAWSRPSWRNWNNSEKACVTSGRKR
jgi:AcrR family transcriptional regulator